MGAVSGTRIIDPMLLHGILNVSEPGLPDWAISRELGYPKVLLATDFYDGRFANFWATRNYDERILGEQILSFSVSLSV